MKVIKPCFWIVIAWVSVTSSVMAQEWFDGGEYDPEIPTIQSVLGFQPPARFTTFYETEKLLHRWAESTDRARLITYGEDYEGKKLYLLIVSSSDNLANLDRHVGNLGKLADPRTLVDGEIDELIERTPATVMISTIDTSEASAVEAMQLVAYQLLAGTDDLSVRIRDNVLTYIVPVENPSARERYVAWYATAQSRIPKADPNAAEHDEPWGVGNDANHYQLDPNRDLVSLTLRENRAKVELIRKWHPEVALDVHEMGINSTFFFPPYPEPYNKNLPTDVLQKWWENFAIDIRSQFDQRGWRYFSGDAFGSPFLGMHTLYTQYHGAIGILFEQAGGSGGLVVERQNGSLLTLEDRIAHHFTGSMSLLKTVVDKRVDLHRDFLSFFRSSLNGVPGFPQKQYVFPATQDTNRTTRFIDTLLAHGVEVRKTKEPFTSSKAHSYFSTTTQKHTFPAGSYVVSLSQPHSRLANAILEKEPYHSIPVFYDVSVWALPYQFGIDGYWTDAVLTAATEPVTELPAEKGSLIGGQASYAYAWAYDGALAAKAAYQLAEEDALIYLHGRPLTMGDVSFEPGAIIVPVDENDQALYARMQKLVQEVPIKVHALNSGHARVGSDLGSRTLRSIPKPSVAVVTREGTDVTSWGSFYFFFDEMYGLPFTPISIDKLAESDLRRYNTIILPDGGQVFTRRGLLGKPYDGYFREEGRENLQTWIEQGGTLITVKGGTSFVSNAETGLAPVESLGSTHQTPGAIVRVKTNRVTPLTLGYPESFHVLARNTRVFEAGEGAESILSYQTGDELKIAGYLTEEDQQLLQGSDYLMTSRLGRGRIMMFAEDPNLRNQWLHMHQLLFNCILFGSLGP